MASHLPSTADVVVIGGGIVGTSTAAALAARDLRVVLVERHLGPAAEASGKAQGILRMQGREAPEIPFADAAMKHWHELAETAPADAELELSFGGNLYFAVSPNQVDELRSLLAETSRAGLDDVELLGPDEVRAIVPAATGPFAAAMWSPRDGHCDPTAVTRYTARLAQDRGATMAYDTTVTGIQVRSGRVAGVTTSRGDIACPAVVAACGIWTPHLLRPVGLPVPIMPVGLCEAMTGPLPQLLGPAVRAHGFGARQRPNGSLVLSAGLDPVLDHRISLYDLQHVRMWSRRLITFRRNVRLRIGWAETARQVRYRTLASPRTLGAPPPVRPDVAQLEQAFRELARVFPAAGATTTHQRWVGWVDMSPDGLPILDASAGPDGLVVIAGLSGHGLTLAPALAEAAAELALTGSSSHPVEPFRLGRFRERPIAMPKKFI